MMMRLTLLLLSVSAVTGYESLPRNVQITDNEIKSFVDSLREHDTDRPSSNQLRISWQKFTNSRDRVDNAQSKLFSHIDDRVLASPTYSKLIDLFDNYNKQTGQREHQTRQEFGEESAFLTAVMQTEVMKSAYLFLHNHKHPFARTPNEFKQWLGKLWFRMYSRARGQPDSSGFEHVFVGEIKNNEIGGLHNWLRFAMLERNNTENFDYKGYILKRQHLMGSMKFSWDGKYKSSGSFLIGTSPEFDLALYTVCFLARPSNNNDSNSCRFLIDGCKFKLISHPLFQQGRVHVGTIFPYADGQCNSQHNRRRGGRN